METQIQQTWKKGKQEIIVNAFICDCGGNIVDVGSAGCSHCDEYTYFGQCIKCKNLFNKHHSFMKDDLEKYGWKLID